jgi:hypothetical protein
MLKRNIEIMTIFSLEDEQEIGIGRHSKGKHRIFHFKEMVEERILI